MDRSDEWELAIARIPEAVDRVLAAWTADHPDLPVPASELPASAWQPDPNQQPGTTRQWAELTRIRAVALRQERRQLYEQATQVHQATQRLHTFLQRPPGDRQGEFTRVNLALILSPRRDRTGPGGR